jgi:hypothetical protein
MDKFVDNLKALALVTIIGLTLYIINLIKNKK